MTKLVTFLFFSFSPIHGSSLKIKKTMATSDRRCHDQPLAPGNFSPKEKALTSFTLRNKFHRNLVSSYQGSRRKRNGHNRGINHSRCCSGSSFPSSDKQSWQEAEPLLATQEARGSQQAEANTASPAAAPAAPAPTPTLRV